MTIVVVGIGADGWDGLSGAARTALSSAEVLFGSARQLALVPVEAQKVAWPSPLLPGMHEALAAHEGRRRVVVASGDPMFYGIGVTLARDYEVEVVPHLSSASLACARMGWARQDVTVVSVVGRPLEALLPALVDEARVLVLSESASTPPAVASLLSAHGFGASAMTVWSQLGGPAEASAAGTAATWSGEVDALNTIAIACVGGPAAAPATLGAASSVASASAAASSIVPSAAGAAPGTSARRPPASPATRADVPEAAPRDRAALPSVPGLPDETYENDGQITKREVRAVLLSLLGPRPGELLWDVGAGTGSVGLEWVRAGGRCVAVERDADKCARVVRNASALGISASDRADSRAAALAVVRADAPAGLSGLPAPDAVFVGGGASLPGLLETCWSALAPGGRLVVNAVTLESEQALLAARDSYGGSLLRLSVQRTAPVGSFTAWKPMTSLTIWSATR